jgi:hypothetical protein
MDAIFAAAVSQLYHRAGDQMSAAGPLKLKVRHSAIGLTIVALAFYFGIIALFVIRSHH